MNTQDTSATLTLDALSIPYQRRIYDYDPSAGKLGIAAAKALGLSPDHVLKTLMVQIDGRPACVVLPADRELDFTRVAAAFGGEKPKCSLAQRQNSGQGTRLAVSAHSASAVLYQQRLIRVRWMVPLSSSMVETEAFFWNLDLRMLS